MSERYIAVTIGPIFDTINLASSPSALWAASYLFSTLSRNICLSLTKNGVSQEAIITPYFDTADPLLNKKDGVGLFHDRIIFSAGNFPIESFNGVKEDAIENTLTYFGFTGKDKAFFKSYFLVSAYEFTSDSPILDSAGALDCLELSKPFAHEYGSNPLLTLFTSDDDDDRNKEIRERVSGEMNISNWQLFNSHRRVMSLEHIARNAVPPETADRFKKYKYYAVVRSDGDRMGEIIKGLGGDAAIRRFSYKCLTYCAKAAEAVHDFGGVTIYSGGDDLLALIPVENKDGNTVFDFIQTVNGIFAKAFADYREAAVSLSFGVFVSYYKFPLYEALAQSAELLFGIAKQSRSCTAIHFQKHAGQSEGLVIPHKYLDRVIELHERITGADNDDVILSAMHKLALFREMFNSADSPGVIQNLFDNTFDADAHHGNAFLKTTLPAFFRDLKNGMEIQPIGDSNASDAVLTMNYILRVLKFFTESGGED